MTVRKYIRGVLVAAFAAVFSLAMSCMAANARSPDRNPVAASTGLIPSSDNAVFVTRVADEVTITWQSDAGMLYTIVAKDRSRRDADWQPVAGYVDMPGTGRTEKVVLRVLPDDPRAFNVRAVPARPPDGPRK